MEDSKEDKIKASKHVNMTILLGVVISGMKKIETANGSLVVTFMLETSETFYNESLGRKKTCSEKHKIVCFDNVAKIALESLSEGETVHIMGSNRSKPICTSNSNKKVISRDVVAKDISIIK